MNHRYKPFWRSVRNVLFILGTLFLVTGLAMFLPIVTTLFYWGEGDFFALASSSAISLGVGALLRWVFRDAIELEFKDALFIATFGWVFVSAISTLPFLLHGSIPSFTNAFFEMMSGYTTTGATILDDIESVPHGLLFWRSETHLLGGMGFLTLAITLMPKGMGGLRIFRADASTGQSITKEKF